MRYLLTAFLSSMVLVLAAVISPAFAGQDKYSASMEAKADTQKLLDETVGTVEKMKADPELNKALGDAEGIFIIPDYGRAAALVGASGGQGVMLAQKNGEWSNPVFYNTGSVSFGAQAGVDAGEVAMLLMTDRAVDMFKQQNNWSLNADADLTIINWSESAQANWGKGDVLIWTDTEGAFAGAAISVSDINADEEANRAYSNSEDPAAILRGDVDAPQKNRLAQVLP